MNNTPRIAFFGTPDFAVWVLDALAARGILPDLIITAPDAPKGRNLIMTSPAAKAWADAKGIKAIQPAEVKSEAFAAELAALGPWDLFIVAAYGFIIPERILYMPTRKTINVHPSLLPLFRGSSPVHAAILNDVRETGVTIMLLDKEMDHGPILAQDTASLSAWPLETNELARILAEKGGDLIADILPQYISGTLQGVEQNHAASTYTKKIKKEDGLMDLSADPYQNFLRFKAYKGWPSSFFFKEIDGKQTRFTITDASFEDGRFVIQKVIPEGKKEVAWKGFDL